MVDVVEIEEGVDVDVVDVDPEKMKRKNGCQSPSSGDLFVLGKSNRWR